MLLLRLWNYIRGYVIILVEGYFLEKFINICIHRQVLLWDIKRCKNCTMTLKISIRGFKLIRPIARKTKCRVRIVKKCGMPFIFNRYKARKAFALGALLFVILFYALSSFIWAVEVSGNKKLEAQVLIDRLEQYGIKPGVVKYNIDTNKIINNIRTDMKELAWIGITVKGTKVKIEIAERVEPPELIDKDTPCNIVALRDGIIKSIIAKAGTEKVLIGETVKRGQVLISGIVANKNEKVEARLVHAMGEVKARTWYEGLNTVKTRVFEKERTGRMKENYSTVLFTKRFGIFQGKIPFEDYDAVEIKKRISIGEDLVLPFEFIIDRYYENNIVERQIEIEEAKKSALSEAYKEATDNMPENLQIVDTNMNFKQDENGELIADVIIECMEEIGSTEKIGGE